jgi:hypothetical protein
MQRSDPNVDSIQYFLDGGSDALGRKARRGWGALESGTWREEVIRNAAAPSWARPLRRREHARCVEMVVERTSSSPESLTIGILPIWTGDNEDSEPGPHWFATHAVVVDGEPIGPWELSPVYEDATNRFDQRLDVDVRCWRVAHVVDVSGYAPSVELAFRGGHFGVLDAQLYSVQAAVPRRGGLLPRPTRDVPMFCQWLEPRTDGVEARLMNCGPTSRTPPRLCPPTPENDRAPRVHGHRSTRDELEDLVPGRQPPRKLSLRSVASGRDQSSVRSAPTQRRAGPPNSGCACDTDATASSSLLLGVSTP